MLSRTCPTFPPLHNYTYHTIPFHSPSITNTYHPTPPLQYIFITYVPNLSLSPYLSHAYQTSPYPYRLGLIDFLSFVPVADVTEKGLSNVILDFLEYSGIDCAYLFGQRTEFKRVCDVICMYVYMHAYMYDK